MAFTVSGELALALPLLAACRHQGLEATHKDDSHVVDETGAAQVFFTLATGEHVDVASAAYVAAARLSGSSTLEGATAVQAAQVASWIEFALEGYRSAARAAFVRTQDATTVRQLSRMGVRSGMVHERLLAALRENEDITKWLNALDTALLSKTYLVGDSLTIADFVVAAAAGDFAFALANPEFELVNAGRWFRTVVRTPAYAALAPMSMTCSTRVGGQIDERAVPAHVAAAADLSMSKNAGTKKAASQRDKEKAAKAAAKKKASAAGGKGGKGATGGGDAKGSGAGAGSGAAAGAGGGTGSPGLPGFEATAEQPASNLAIPDLSKEEKIAKTAAKLDELGITYKRHDHGVADTVEAMMSFAGDWEGVKCKNLFLKAKKKVGEDDTGLWLVVAAVDSDTNMKSVGQKLGYGKIVVRFAKEDLLTQHLGVKQGSVSPFCLMNDTALQVNVAFDSKILDADLANFHPMSNEATFTVSPKDLLKFVAATGHKHTVLEL